MHLLLLQPRRTLRLPGLLATLILLAGGAAAAVGLPGPQPEQACTPEERGLDVWSAGTVERVRVDGELQVRRSR